MGDPFKQRVWSYGVGLARYRQLNAATAHACARLAAQFATTGERRRAFEELRYAAQSWLAGRRVVARLEHMEQGDYPRYIVTSLAQDARPFHDGLCRARGEIESRIEEAQLGLFADRASYHCFSANPFRLLLSSPATVKKIHEIVRAHNKLLGKVPPTANQGGWRNIRAILWAMDIESSVDAVKEALHADPRVSAAILFGSAARGVARPSSDLDIAIVAASREALSSIDAEFLDLFARLTRAAGRDVHLVVLDTAEPVLGRQTFLDSRKLFDRDPGRTADVLERILVEYFDGEYHRRLRAEALERRREERRG